MRDFDPDFGGFFVRTVARTPLTPGEPNHYIVRFTSELRRYLRDDEEPGKDDEVVEEEVEPSKRVATLQWSIINLRAATEAGEPWFDVMDADSSEMLEVLATITPPEAAANSEQLTFESWGNVIYFRDFDVSPDYDTRLVARSLIDHVLIFHGDAAGAVFIFGVNDQPAVRDAFKDCAFGLVRRKDDMEFYVFDLALKRPPPADRSNVSSIRRPPVRED